MGWPALSQAELWYMRNQRALYNNVEGARPFLESGVIVGTKSVTVLSLPHLQVYVTGEYVKGTLSPTRRRRRRRARFSGCSNTTPAPPRRAEERLARGPHALKYSSSRFTSQRSCITY